MVTPWCHHGDTMESPKKMSDFLFFPRFFRTFFRSLRGHFRVMCFDIFGLFRTCSGSVPRRFRDHRKVFPRPSRGVSGDFFFDIFGSVHWCLPVFFRWVLDIFGQLLFFEGEVGPDSTGPLGPQGPLPIFLRKDIYIYIHDGNSRWTDEGG